MWTIGKLLAEAAPFIESKGVPTARLEAEILLGHTLRLDRVALFTGFDRPLDNREVDRFREFVLRRIRGEPSAYITGEREFFSLPFSVSPAVLIPRPETEELVQAALDTLDALRPDRKNGDGLVAADVGTGSGCIAVTLASLRSGLHLAATDISEAALKVAGENARRHEVADRIVFARGHMAEPLKAIRPDGGFHIVACNPPYIDPEGDLPVDRSVRDFEPPEALFTPPGDPLHPYREVFKGAAGLLAPDGRLLFELARGMADRVAACAGRYGFGETARIKDLAGIERTAVFAPVG